MIKGLKLLEKHVKQSVIDLLQFLENKRNLYHFKSQVIKGQLLDQRTRKTRWFSTGRPGLQDCTICYKYVNGGEKFGLYVGFEFKRSKGGIRSDEQKETQAFINSLGGYYFFIDDYIKADEAFQLIDQDMRNKIARIKNGG